jgi:hypothetical protein
MRAPLSRSLIVVLALVACPLWAARAAAQNPDPPPRIGPFVFDVYGTIPLFPQSEQLAASRDLLLTELPRRGVGIHGGAHLYVLKIKAVTFGVGVDVAAARAHKDAIETAEPPTQAVTETFTHIAPQLSLNFGTGKGWSYLSAGLGTSVWSILRDGTTPEGPNSERLRTLNYGGGARWFLNPHLAFSVDARFYAIDPSSPYLGRVDGPRTTLLLIGAGISVK